METLIAKYLSGEASSEETKQLLEWIALQQENQDYFEKAKKIFDLTATHYGRNMTVAPIDVDNEWRSFQLKVNKKGDRVIQMPPTNHTSVWMKVAAAVLVMVASGFAVYWLAFKNNQVVFESGAAALSVKLPDGSSAVLNAHSRLAWSSDFGKNKREVELTGEGFFDVTHDDTKKFVVKTAQTTIEDIGTSFTIRNLPNEKGVEVIVQTGVVLFSVASSGKQLRLSAGQQGIYTSGSNLLEGNANADPNFLSWHTRRIIFSGSDLKTVVETLNKTYGSDISISTTVPPSCAVTATFDHQSLESVLHVLETTLNLTIKISGNQIVITGAGC